MKGGVKMVFLAKGVCIVKRKGFKTIIPKTKEKALRLWEKCQRRGLCAHLVYWAIRGGVKLPFLENEVNLKP